ncbi:MAG: hypothetical protein QOE51_1105 [Actinoplanes sp.]|nr:hypothetical protein [Actinoplanes sp.]
MNVLSEPHSTQFARGPVLGLESDLAGGTMCLRSVYDLRLTHSRT